MKTIAVIFIVLAWMMNATIAPAQALTTNGPTPSVPMIKISGVPIGVTIENLARQAEINFMVSPRLTQAWLAGKEPLVNFQQENISAYEALGRLLDQHKLILATNSPTGIARIIRNDEPASLVDGSLIGMETNIPAGSTNGVIPLIQFADTPLDIAFENLIKYAGIKLGFTPPLIIINADGEPITVTVRWKNVTLKQAIVALCENYNLVIVKDDSGSLQIKPRETKQHNRLKPN